MSKIRQFAQKEKENVTPSLWLEGTVAFSTTFGMEKLSATNITKYRFLTLRKGIRKNGVKHAESILYILKLSSSRWYEYESGSWQEKKTHQIASHIFKTAVSEASLFAVLFAIADRQPNYDVLIVHYLARIVICINYPYRTQLSALSELFELHKLKLEQGCLFSTWREDRAPTYFKTVSNANVFDLQDIARVDLFLMSFHRFVLDIHEVFMLSLRCGSVAPRFVVAAVVVHCGLQSSRGTIKGEKSLSDQEKGAPNLRESSIANAANEELALSVTTSFSLAKNLASDDLDLLYAAKEERNIIARAVGIGRLASEGCLGCGVYAEPRRRREEARSGQWWTKAV
ncbi:hypothetical protein K438DRAFT_1793040 [Mycena galopus ATCC 62051]|nr:hypothetical protein K438DRAFT_1793040 [Mycena galopus ATCC 62051]